MKKILFIIFIIFSITDSYAIVRTKKVSACVDILLKNGEKFQAEIVSNQKEKFSYKKCNVVDAAEIMISKKEVSSIKTASGEIIYQDAENGIKRNIFEENSREKEWNKMAIASVASLVVACTGYLAIIGIPLAIILGAIALKQIDYNPEKYKGKWVAQMGIVLGVIAILAALLIIIAFLNSPLWVF